jgi:hypothetical protein
MTIRDIPMLLLLCCWLLLLVTSLVTGVLVVLLLGGLDRSAGERLSWTTIWCGLLTQGCVALGLSLLGPLNLAAGVCGLLAAAALALGPVRRSLARAVGELRVRGRDLLALGVLAVVTALYCSQPPCNYDTLLYHHQLTRWLAEHGAVRGLVLIHYRFGFLSSSFALAAPVESLVPGRSATVINGLVLLLALWQLYFAAARLLSGCGRGADLFVVAGLGAVLGLHLLFLEPVGAAPDFLVSVATVVVAAGLLSPHEALSGGVSPAVLATAVLLPSVKLSAAPVAAVVVLAVLVPRGCAVSLRARLVRSAACAALLLVPLVLVSWQVTGSLLFPAPSLTTDVDWALDPAQTRAVAADIRDWARWSGPPPEGAEAGAWLRPWLASAKGKLFCLLAAGNLAAAVWVVGRSLKSRTALADGWVPAMGLVGTAYLLIAAPNPRFGFGVLSLGWSWLALRVLGPRLAPADSQPDGTTTPGSGLGGSLLAASALVGILVALVLSPVDSWRRALERLQHRSLVATRDGRLNVWLPAAVPAIGYVRQERGGATEAFPIDLREGVVHDVRYHYPANTDVVGPAPLPAAPEPLRGVRLAEPRRGIRGGFVRQERNGKS